ncbi:L-rhamnose-binding lectin CSL3-like [Branchiostoma floridae x Branchiostoma belcheri]
MLGKHLLATAVVLAAIHSTSAQGGGGGPRTVRACEREAPLSLSCSSGMIHIMAALYGRKQTGICSGPVLTTNCESSTSLSTVKSKCEGHSSCSVQASNSLFGDPCHGTVKYLEVTYQCVDAAGPRTVQACEREAPLSLSCSSGMIHITAALYGRKQTGICSGPALTTNCESSTSLSTVKSKCEGHSSCSVQASNSLFGDPCQGTVKYLEVTYKCGE